MNSRLTVKQINGDCQEILRCFYIDSEFLDPIDEIIEKIAKNTKEPISSPFGVYRDDDIVSFFTLESSNPNVQMIDDFVGSYWLDSFFITKHYRGRGLAKTIFLEIINNVKVYFPHATSLNLTVNFRNKIAKKIYQDCGVLDTGMIYRGGPAGPQHIYSISI